MAMGRQGDRQGDLMVMWSEMPRSPGHVFYDRLQEVLVGAGFDGFVEDACQAYYARPCKGRRKYVPTGRSNRVPTGAAMNRRPDILDSFFIERSCAVLNFSRTA